MLLCGVFGRCNESLDVGDDGVLHIGRDVGCVEVYVEGFGYAEVEACERHFALFVVHLAVASGFEHSVFGFGDFGADGVGTCLVGGVAHHSRCLFNNQFHCVVFKRLLIMCLFAACVLDEKKHLEDHVFAGCRDAGEGCFAQRLECIDFNLFVLLGLDAFNESTVIGVEAVGHFALLLGREVVVVVVFLHERVEVFGLESFGGVALEFNLGVGHCFEGTGGTDDAEKVGFVGCGEFCGVDCAQGAVDCDGVAHFDFLFVCHSCMGLK